MCFRRTFFFVRLGKLRFDFVKKFTCVGTDVVDSCKQFHSLQRTFRRAADISIVKVLKRDMQIATNGFIGFDILSTVLVQMSSDVSTFRRWSVEVTTPREGIPAESFFLRWVDSQQCLFSER